MEEGSREEGERYLQLIDKSSNEGGIINRVNFGNGNFLSVTNIVKNGHGPVPTFGALGNFFVIKMYISGSWKGVSAMDTGEEEYEGRGLRRKGGRKGRRN
jgi:hypothetical protein